MRLKKLFLAGIMILSFVSISCAKPKIKAKVIKNDLTVDLNDCWLFSSGKSFFALNKANLSECVHVEFDTFVSNPFVYNNKIYFGDQGKVPGDFGHGIYVFDRKFKLLKNIPSLPNVRNLVQVDKFLIADTLCFFKNGESGFTVIDLETDQKVYVSSKEPNIINNQGNIWSYNNQLILGFNQKSLDSKIFSYSFEVQGENLKLKRKQINDKNYPSFNSVIAENLLFLNLKNENEIVVFDLDKNQEAACIDFRKYLPKSVETITNRKPYFFNDCYYLLVYEADQTKNNAFNAILKYDLQKEKVYIQKINCNARALNEIKMCDEEYIYLRQGFEIEKVKVAFIECHGD